MIIENSNKEDNERVFAGLCKKPMTLLIAYNYELLTELDTIKNLGYCKDVELTFYYTLEEILKKKGYAKHLVNKAIEFKANLN